MVPLPSLQSVQNVWPFQRILKDSQRVNPSISVNLFTCERPRQEPSVPCKTSGVKTARREVTKSPNIWSASGASDQRWQRYQRYQRLKRTTTVIIQATCRNLRPSKIGHVTLVRCFLTSLLVPLQHLCQPQTGALPPGLISTVSFLWGLVITKTPVLTCSMAYSHIVK